MIGHEDRNQEEKKGLSPDWSADITEEKTLDIFYMYFQSG
jgi:hypothetical protein